ncbi:MAG: helix-turn-helix domain-containing protein [Acidobacteria bacterium]|nr:helix-turn-helix domain-containing protein [Acidobacteriota bacterium]
MVYALSTTPVGNSLNISQFFLSKVGNVTENLAEFVRRVRNEKGLSTPDVERLSGNRITDGYVSRIENNGVRNVSPEKLSALAKGLGVTEEEVFAAARGKTPNRHVITDEKFELLSLKFGTLDGRQKAKAEVLIDVLERELERLSNEKQEQ